MAHGFAIPFALGGYWHTMGSISTEINWWKNWEMTIGLGGGAAWGLAFLWFNVPQRLSRWSARHTGLLKVNQARDIFNNLSERLPGCQSKGKGFQG